MMRNPKIFTALSNYSRPTSPRVAALCRYGSLESQSYGTAPRQSRTLRVLRTTHLPVTSGVDSSIAIKCNLTPQTGCRGRNYSSASPGTPSFNSTEIETRVQEIVNTSRDSIGNTLSEHLRLSARHYENGTCISVEVNRPKKRNALSRALLDELAATFRAIGSHDRVRAVAFEAVDAGSATKPVFCAGADLSVLSSLNSPEEATTFIRQVTDVSTAIRQLPVPVICFVNGLCVGAGLEIAASCDIRAATRASAFAMPETKIGIPSVVEARLLAALMGWGRMREFIYTGRTIDAAEALSGGLVTSVVSDRKELDTLRDDYLAQFANMGARGIRSQKRLITKWEESTVQEGIEAGVASLAEMFEDGGKDFREQLKRARG